MKKLNMVYILGLSGSGKSYLARLLNGKTLEINNKDIKFKKLTQVTTREPREEEKDSKEIDTYRFITDTEYENGYRWNCFATMTHYTGGKYGTIMPEIKEIQDDAVFLTIVNKDGLYNAIERLEERYGDEFDINYTIAVIINTRNCTKLESRACRDRALESKELDIIIEKYNPLKIFNTSYTADGVMKILAKRLRLL